MLFPIPEEWSFISNNNEEVTQNDLKEMYRSLSNAIRGNIDFFTPIVYGAGAAGVGTYSEQNGVIARSIYSTDIWFNVYWTAHTGAGELRVQIPLTCDQVGGQPFVGSCEISNGLTLAVGYTWCTCKANENSTFVNIVQNGSGVNSAAMGIQAQGRLRCHVRFFGKYNK